MAKKQNNNIEKELKFKIDSDVTKTELDRFLSELGLVTKEMVLQKDVYWDNPNCDIINLKRGLRTRYISNQIRDVEFKSLFKTSNGQYVVEEIKILKNSQLDVSSLKEIMVNRLGLIQANNFVYDASGTPEDILTSLGLSPVVTLEKERQIWEDQNGNVEVSVDSITNLGIFVEIEQVGNFSQVFDEIVEKFTKSNFATLDSSHSGYLDMILDKNNKIISKDGFEIKFHDDNMWNVQEGERDIFLNLTQTKA